MTTRLQEQLQKMDEPQVKYICDLYYENLL